MIYLDNAATTKILPDVLEEMMPFLTEQYGNPGSLHSIGRKARDAISLARNRVADLIGAEEEQIIFTSCGSEANNLAISGSREHLNSIHKPIILTSPTEHNSVLNAARNYDCWHTHVDEFGEVIYDDIEEQLKTRHTIGFTSIMYSNNEIGTVNDILKISETCRKYNVLFHTDCVQAAGTMPINVKEIKCDFLSLSGHKIHAPKGVGALYVRDKSILSPIIYGGSRQEFGLRGGTENVASIVGFGKACEIAKNNLAYNRKKISELRSEFLSCLNNEFNYRNFKINGKTNGIVNEKVINIQFDGIDAETLVMLLETRGVCISSGAACTSRESIPSHVLAAIGLSSLEARGSVRFSFSEINTIDEIRQATKIISQCVNELRSYK